MEKRMAYLQQYSVRKNRLMNSSVVGMNINDKGELLCDESQSLHYLFLTPFDNGVEDGEWGRFVFDANIPEDTEITIFYFASNTLDFTRKEQPARIPEFLCGEDEPSTKLELFRIAGATEVRATTDTLMYGVNGRYLFVAIRIEGSFDGPIKNIRVVNPGDTFMNVLPEIYNKRGEFFHRYLSVMSSLFNDFQDKIDNYERFLNPDYADSQLLSTYAGWMGIDVSGNFLEEETLRTLVKEAPVLNRKKGTKAALQRICEIVLSEKCIIVERKADLGSDKFGDDRFDVTILVKTFVEDKKKSQLFFLLSQFVPVRSHLQIIYLDKNSELDTHSYLDINASVFNTQEGVLDGHMLLDSNILMPGGNEE